MVTQLAQLAEILQLAPLSAPHGSLEWAQVSTDTRKMPPKSLFVALVGEHFDGHDHLAQAREKGAVAALVSRPVADPLPQLVVPDTLQALADWARWQRQHWQGPMIAVTGNNGKTTVKELLGAILRLHYGDVLVTAGNLNNHIGMPLTLIQLASHHQAAVIEMGANHLREIDALASLACPDFGVITNVTGAHLGEFGSMEAIAEAKGELLAHLPPSGTAILNADDTYCGYWQAQSPCQVQTFGLTQGDWQAKALTLYPEGGASFTLSGPDGIQRQVRLQLSGRHNVSNALAAMTGALSMGIPVETVIAGVANVQPAAGRLQVTQGLMGITLIDDSYNANPGSTRAAIDLLALRPASTRWLLLADMKEMGPESERFHREIGEYARQQGIDHLLSYGDMARLAATAFGLGGEAYETQEALLDAVIPRLDAQSVILIKGSRSAHMEHLVTRLQS